VSKAVSLFSFGSSYFNSFKLDTRTLSLNGRFQLGLRIKTRVGQGAKWKRLGNDLWTCICEWLSGLSIFLRVERTCRVWMGDC
jgi:hypothetical protein